MIVQVLVSFHPETLSFPDENSLAVEKDLIRQSVQKSQVQGAKKAQGRSVFLIREGLNFLQRRSNWEFFNGLLYKAEIPS